ncbi:aminotransferase class V-fold PLP-dependent enzyme [Amycolatopsis jejuensis]|uniref:aminotransferase class V-fold PLP-dependent enzyme n=1 Tax=Amycolatopsis jejuensis TaxID=330084 RepID=UPI00138E5144|nr:aminotransferase class V-fold PLP-dependent enzyme [Amycolatopsis jejuensis]
MTTTPPEVTEFRRQFPIFERKVHLASNSRGAMHVSHPAAFEEYTRLWVEGGTPWGPYMERTEDLRAGYAEFIGASPHEIAITASATTGLASVASALDAKKRPVVVIDDYNFPSIVYLWLAQQARGIELRRVSPNDEGIITPEAFDAVLDERVAMVSVTHVCFKNGHRLDLAAVGKRARDVGAIFAVDDYHCTGARVLDVDKLNIDVLTTGTVKFLLGGAGVGLLYVRDQVVENLHPTVTGWFGQDNPDNIQIDELLEAGDARRFQITAPALSGVYESYAGLKVLQEVGATTIEPYIEGLTARAMDRLDAAGFVSPTPADPNLRGPLVTVRAKDPGAAVAKLAEHDIVVSHRGGNIRAAFHYYNTFEDIDRLIDALEDARDLMVTASDVPAPVH